VNSPDLPSSEISSTENESAASSTQASGNSMAEFYQLKQELLVYTLVLIALIVFPVWYFYSLNIALNYLIGACTGVVYLRMLARNVEQLGKEKSKIGKTQLAVFVGLIIVATQWNQLHVVPIFLGFLTYKAAILFYTLRTVLAPQ
jgi:ATP synthase protein I